MIKLKDIISEDNKADQERRTKYRRINENYLKWQTT